MIAASIAREQLRQKSLELGFVQFGIVEAQLAPGFDSLQQWLDRGYAGGMSYIANRREAYRRPASVLSECKTVVMLVLPYQPNPQTMQSKAEPALSEYQEECSIGSYACGQADYHDVIREKLNLLGSSLKSIYPEANFRGVVDTAPLMERDFAQLAGLGWIGKNTLLLNRKLGSFYFLAALLTDWIFPPDAPMTADHCGTCTACLDACPTGALVEPRVLDASRCISYLTIEHRGMIEPSLSAGMQDWIFGCDVCQIVCPWNRRPRNDVGSELTHDDMQTKTSLTHWLTLDEEGFRRLYRKTPFWRTKLAGMQRNAMIVAANTNRQDLRGVIERFLSCDDPVLVATSQWSLGRLASASPHS